MSRSSQVSRRLTPPPLPTHASVPALNRRLARRRRVQMEVVIHPLLDPERQPWFSEPRWGTCRDLTEHGMLVGGTGYLPLGAVVWVFFILPDGDPVSCYGRVIRHELWGRPRYGIKFVGLRPSDSRRIRRLVG